MKKRSGVARGEQTILTAGDECFDPPQDNQEKTDNGIGYALPNAHGGR